MGKLNWGKRACAVFALWAATAIALPAQTFTALHSFDSTDGSAPTAALVQGTDGNLYGTTKGGGANGSGTVFKITPSGTLVTIYSFCSGSGCPDGAKPLAGLIQATDGNFYGTTANGGINGESGTVFKISPTGKLTVLYSFCSQSGCTDGAGPTAGLAYATDGNFYGTTSGGGANGHGTIFRMSRTGTLTTLYSFCSQAFCTDGQNPESGLTQAADGSLYGTTYEGGAQGLGSVFKITLSGTLTTLYSFCSEGDCADGQWPSAALLHGANGNFYGTTVAGGSKGGYGTIFKITPSGALTEVYRFCAQTNCADGENPSAALIQATDGNFYGTTLAGGVNGVGAIYKITPSGIFTALYSFCSDGVCTDGDNPAASLVQNTGGSLYGTTLNGGANGCCYGTIFSLSVGLGPFVETQPASGKVGAAVKILGTNLVGATSVTFNGTAAVFHVISGSLITAAVPTGATNGKVQVVTPGGTLSSNVPFRVLP